MNNDNTISVIVAAYNCEKTIERCVNSLITEPEVKEVIIVNDASTDNTRTIIYNMCKFHNKIIFKNLSRNKGPAYARNVALKLSSGEWISIVDSDDYIISGRFKKLLCYAKSNQALMVADNLYKILENNKPNLDSYLMDNDFSPKYIDLEKFILSNISDKNTSREEMGFIKPIIKKSVLDEFNINYNDRMRLGEDYELYVRVLACIKKFLLVPATGYLAIVRESSLSSNHSVADLKFLRDCNIEIINTYNLNKNEILALKNHYIDTDCRLQWRNIILAVKNKDIILFCKAFARPLPVIRSNLKNLYTDFNLRVLKERLPSVN